MKKIFPFMIILILAGCAKKEWSKSYIAKKCSTELQKQNETDKSLNQKQVGDICDCVADKMLVKYKSEAEADKDSDGGAAMGKECAQEVLQTE